MNRLFQASSFGAAICLTLGTISGVPRASEPIADTIIAGAEPAASLPTRQIAKAKAAPPEATTPVDLPIEEIFRRPIGPRGLEYTEKAKGLVGRTVRVSGFMVRQTAPVPFSLLLTPLPMQMHEREYGLADDLPANTIHVSFSRGPFPVIPHTRHPIAVEGVLELGPIEEADGRLSHVRVRNATPWRGHRTLNQVTEASVAQAAPRAAIRPDSYAPALSRSSP